MPEQKFDFRKPKKEPPKGFWETLWGTYWFELFILILFILGIAGLFLPFLADKFALNWEYLKIVIQKIIRPIFIAVDILITGVFIFAFIKGWAWRPKYSIFQKPTHATKKHEKKIDKDLAAHWERIRAKATTDNADNLRLAFIEADTIIDVFLRKAGYIGETMGDRLKRISGQEVQSLEDVWRAHRLRNDVVHTPGFILRSEDARRGIEAFEAFLVELGAIEPKIFG